MSISPAQMILQVANTEALVPAPRPASASVPAAAGPAGSPTKSPSPVPVVASPAEFSTDQQVDDHHQVYYEFVDKSTGDVVFEIPPEALREIGESLSLSLVGEATGQSVDVKS